MCLICIQDDIERKGVVYEYNYIPNTLCFNFIIILYYKIIYFIMYTMYFIKYSTVIIIISINKI